MWPKLDTTTTVIQKLILIECDEQKRCEDSKYFELVTTGCNCITIYICLGNVHQPLKARPPIKGRFNFRRKQQNVNANVV